MLNHLQQLAMKLEVLRDEYMRYAVEKCLSVLREYHSAVETITGLILFCFVHQQNGLFLSSPSSFNTVTIRLATE